MLWAAVVVFHSAEVTPASNLLTSPSALTFEVRTDSDSSSHSVGSPFDTGDLTFYKLEMEQPTHAQLLFNLSVVQRGECPGVSKASWLPLLS